MKKIYKPLTAIILSGILLISTLCASTFAQPENKIASTTSQNEVAGAVGSKEEVVYATLNGDGTVDGIYVVNVFDVISSGAITDYGDYNTVKNLTNLQDVTNKDGSITAVADTGKFYYQGNMTDTNLPWNIAIKYTLDGREISSGELAGKDGKLKIQLQTTQNNMFDPSFYEYYMLQISITLDSAKCANITADTATITNLGKSKMVTFIVMPDTVGDMYVNADVNDFEMEGISISAVPFSMNINLPDTSKMTDGLTEVSNAVMELDDGITQLKNGVKALNNGAAALKNGSLEYKKGINEISAQSDTIISASKTIGDSLGVISKSINTISSQLISSLPESDTGDSLSQLSNGISLLADNYTSFHSGLVAYTEGVAQLEAGYARVNSGISDLAEGTRETLDGAAQLSDGVSQLNKHTKDLPKQIQDAATQVIDSYDTSDYVPVSFASDKNTKVTAVQFVLMTKGVKKEAVPVPLPEAKPKTFWTRLKDLFINIF